jgi:UTP-glucose-1-phosphate uridylyltransferase
MKHDGGFIGVDLDDCQWYDSGRPETWLQAQVDHALRRDDISESMREWLQDRLNQ